MLKCITKKKEDTYWEQGKGKQFSQYTHSSAWKLGTAQAQERRKKQGTKSEILSAILKDTWDSISYTQGLGIFQMAPVEIPLTDH